MKLKLKLESKDLTRFQLTFLYSFIQVESPFESVYWRPKNQTSRRPIVLTTWSKSCLPVVVCWMANSNSASIVVTRTFSCQSRNNNKIRCKNDIRSSKAQRAIDTYILHSHIYKCILINTFKLNLILFRYRNK